MKVNLWFFQSNNLNSIIYLPPGTWDFLFYMYLQCLFRQLLWYANELATVAETKYIEINIPDE